MKIEVWQGDITELAVDAIVNAAKQTLLGGGGVDGMIHRVAGPGLAEECRQLPLVRPGVRCPTGEVRATAGHHLPAPTIDEVQALMRTHLQAHYGFYGDYLGVRTARKHIGWYVQDLAGAQAFRAQMNQLEDCTEQLAAVAAFFESQRAHGERLQYLPSKPRQAA